MEGTRSGAAGGDRNAFGLPHIDAEPAVVSVESHRDGTDLHTTRELSDDLQAHLRASGISTSEVVDLSAVETLNTTIQATAEVATIAQLLTTWRPRRPARRVVVRRKRNGDREIQFDPVTLDPQTREAVRKLLEEDTEAPE